MYVSRILLGFIAMGAAVVPTLATTRDAVAQFPGLHHQHVRAHYGLRSYNYGHDRPRFTDSALAVADAVQAQTWFDETGPW